MAWRVIVAAAFCIFVSGQAMAFDIEAHRGGRALFPENTLAAFATVIGGRDFRQLDTSVGASGPHDFAVRRSARSSIAPPASIASRASRP